LPRISFCSERKSPLLEGRGRMGKHGVLTEEFVSEFLFDTDKWGKYRSRNRGLE